MQGSTHVGTLGHRFHFFDDRDFFQVRPFASGAFPLGSTLLIHLSQRPELGDRPNVGDKGEQVTIEGHCYPLGRSTALRTERLDDLLHVMSTVCFAYKTHMKPLERCL